MSSSVRAKMAEVHKEHKHAAQERIKQQDDQQQHQEAEVGRAPAEASGSDSSEPSGQVAPKKVVKKKTRKKG